MDNLSKEIEKLKKEKNAIILAHYYVDGAVQDVADYIGDSFYLAKVAAKNDAEMIVFAGVSFMGESAKILSPEKKVCMAEQTADCPMAHMVTLEEIKKVRDRYDDLAVVCYINSTAEIKTASDVCVTSSNAVNIVKKLKEHNIFFIPDKNLGSYVAKQVPEKNFIFCSGFCPIHNDVTVDMVMKAKESYPSAKFAVHPECRPEILELADYIGSTSGIISFCKETDAKEIIIGTVEGVCHQIEKHVPDKRLIGMEPRLFCVNMGKITLENVYDALKFEDNQMEVDERIASESKKPLGRMLELG